MVHVRTLDVYPCPSQSARSWNTGRDLPRRLGESLEIIILSLKPSFSLLEDFTVHRLFTFKSLKLYANIRGHFLAHQHQRYIFPGEARALNRNNVFSVHWRDP